MDDFDGGMDSGDIGCDSNESAEIDTSADTGYEGVDTSLDDSTIDMTEGESYDIQSDSSEATVGSLLGTDTDFDIDVPNIEAVSLDGTTDQSFDDLPEMTSAEVESLFGTDTQTINYDEVSESPDILFENDETESWDETADASTQDLLLAGDEAELSEWQSQQAKSEIGDSFSADHSIDMEEHVTCDLQTEINKADAEIYRDTADDLMVEDIQSDIGDLHSEIETESASLDDKFEEQTDAPYAGEEFHEDIPTKFEQSESSEELSEIQSDTTTEEISDDAPRFDEANERQGINDEMTDSHDQQELSNEDEDMRLSTDDMEVNVNQQIIELAESLEPQSGVVSDLMEDSARDDEMQSLTDEAMALATPTAEARSEMDQKTEEFKEPFYSATEEVTEIKPKADLYGQFEKELFADKLDFQKSDSELEERWVNSADVHGVRYHDDLSDEKFWSHHGNSKERYMELASKIPEVKEQMDSGRSLEDIVTDERLGPCAAQYFKPDNMVKVYQYGDKYMFDSDGRHRVMAAQELGYEIPINLRGVYTSKN